MRQAIKCKYKALMSNLNNNFKQLLKNKMKFKKCKKINSTTKINLHRKFSSWNKNYKLKNKKKLLKYKLRL